MKRSETNKTKQRKGVHEPAPMIYRRIAPGSGLEKIIECYWIIDSEQDATMKVEKIVPDGFPEMIFHYKDPYMIRLAADWELQPLNLIAGQIKKHFYLGNTGRSGMVGVKFKPAALAHLFGINMSTLTDKVLEMEQVLGSYFNELIASLKRTEDIDEKAVMLDSFFYRLLSERPLTSSKIDDALSLIFSSNGTVTVKELCNGLDMGERQIERLFNEYVGLPPKFYSRIIRFSQIFQHIQKGDPFWTDTVYRTGFYDQSHFIKNFKAFTGEEPSEYLFEELNIANFFLNK